MSEKTKTLFEAVATGIAGFGPAVQDAAVNYFVEKEKKRRVDALIAGLDQQKQMNSELKKLSKPDQISKDLEGKTVSESFSPAAQKKYQETKQKADKLDKALDKALNGDFGDLYQQVSKGGGEAKAEEATE